MMPLTSELVAEVLAELHAAFPSAQRAKDSDMTTAVYRNGLNGVSGDAVRYAAKVAIQDDEYFPKVARLRDLALRFIGQRRAQDAAAQALDPFWCRGCGESAVLTLRWRPKRDARGQPVHDDRGRRGLESFQRHHCRCSPACRWTPDAPDDPWMIDA